MGRALPRQIGADGIAMIAMGPPTKNSPPGLVGALNAIEASAIPRAQKKSMVWKALNEVLGATGRELGVLRTVQRGLSVARGMLGDRKLGVGDLQGLLRSLGWKDVADRLCANNRARRTVAHPDDGLVDDIRRALQGTCAGEDKGTAPVTEADVPGATVAPWDHPDAMHVDQAPREEGWMQVFVRTVSGRTLALDVSPDASVQTLKSKIRDRTSVPPDCSASSMRASSWTTATT